MKFRRKTIEWFSRNNIKFSKWFHIYRGHYKRLRLTSTSLSTCCHTHRGHIRKWMLTTLEDANLLKVEFVDKKLWWETSEYKNEDTTQSNFDLRQNTNTPTNKTSLSVYETIYFEMLGVVKKCQVWWSCANSKRHISLNVINKIYYKYGFCLGKHQNGSERSLERFPQNGSTSCYFMIVVKFAHLL